jgi:hypothetical protein
MLDPDRRIVGLATAALAIASFGLAVFPIAVSARVVQPAALGVSLAAYPAVYGLTQFVAGPAVDRFGGHVVLVGATAIMAAGLVGTFLGGVCTLIARIAAGFGAGFVLTAGFDRIASSIPAENPRRFATFASGWGAGLITAAAWGLAAASGAVREAAIWLLTPVAVAILFGTAVAGQPRRIAQHDRALPDTGLSGGAWMAIAALAATSLGNLYVQIGLLSWAPIWLREGGYSAEQAATLPVATFGLGFLCGATVASRLRLPVSHVFLLASMVSASAAAMLAVGAGLGATAVALLAAGIGSSIYVGPGYAWLRDKVPVLLAARASALANGFAWVGSAAAPPVIAALIRADASAAFLQLAGVAVATGALGVLAVRVAGRRLVLELS